MIVTFSLSLQDLKDLCKGNRVVLGSSDLSGFVIKLNKEALDEIDAVMQDNKPSKIVDSDVLDFVLKGDRRDGN